MHENWSKRKGTPSYYKKYWTLIQKGPEIYTLNHIINKKITQVQYIRYADTTTQEIRELRHSKETENELLLWDLEENQWTKIKVK